MFVLATFVSSTSTKNNIFSSCYNSPLCELVFTGLMPNLLAPSGHSRGLLDIFLSLSSRPHLPLLLFIIIVFILFHYFFNINLYKLTNATCKHRNGIVQLTESLKASAPEFLFFLFLRFTLVLQALVNLLEINVK